MHQRNHCYRPLPDRFTWCVLAIAALILVCQLGIPPVVGAADNGDWYKIMEPAGFKHLPDPPRDARYFTEKVAFSKPEFRRGAANYLASGRLVALVARVIGPIFSRDGLFDLRIMGLLYSLLLLLGFGLVLVASNALPTIPRWLLAVLLVFFFTDFGYVSFFNSFYSQTASVIFLVTTAGCFALMLRTTNHERYWFAAFAISSLLFVTSKPQEAPQSLLLGVLLLVSPVVLKLQRSMLIGLVSTLLIVTSAAICNHYASKPVHNQSLFNHFFEDLLRNSPDAAADLRTFNVNPELIRYKATHAFAPGTPILLPSFQEEFYAHVGYDDVLFFYLARPVRLWQLLARRASSAFSLMTIYGNFDRSAGRPAWAQSNSLRVWSSLKKTVFPGSIWTLVAFLIAHATAAIALWRRGDPSPRFRLGLAGFAILNLMAIGAFVLCAMSDGTLDVIRQLYAFNAMTDLLLLIDVVALSVMVIHFWPLRWQRQIRLA